MSFEAWKEIHDRRLPTERDELLRVLWRSLEYPSIADPSIADCGSRIADLPDASAGASNLPTREDTRPTPGEVAALRRLEVANAEIERLKQQIADCGLRIADLPDASAVYELRDTSDEEMYHHVGMIRTLEAALAVVAEKPWELCEYADDNGHARLDIYKHEVGKIGIDAGVRVWSGAWHQTWSEQDEQTWEGGGALVQANPQSAIRDPQSK